MKNATIRQLQIFSVAASHLSFARTAENLHLTHAAISLQIKQLEDVCGTLLFERIGKRVFLTEAGEILLEHARQILQSLKDADEALLALKGLKGGRIAVAVATTAEYFAPGLLAEFGKAHAEVRIRLLIDNPYVFGPFWDFQRGEIDEADYQARFAASRNAAMAAIGRMETARVLTVVFDRLYTLRNQLVHGGATWNGSINRSQVRDGSRIIAHLVPTVIHLMMNNPNALWGDAAYPVVQSA